MTKVEKNLVEAAKAQAAKSVIDAVKSAWIEVNGHHKRMAAIRLDRAGILELDKGRCGFWIRIR